MIKRKHRAEPLAAEERRKSIITALIPLLLEQGASVTTKQIAQAAGIAEGTIFRVFPDKAALIFEAIRVSMDPGPVETALAEIYPAASIEVKMAEAGRILQERYDRVFALFSVLRAMSVGTAARNREKPPMDFVTHSTDAIETALTRMFEGHRDQLRVEPSRAATILRALVFASGHTVFGGTRRLTVTEIVDTLASGILEPGSDDESLRELANGMLGPGSDPVG